MLALAFAESIQLFPDGTIVLHIILILVMIWVLNRTLFRPINAIIAKREKYSGGANTEAAEILENAAAKEEKYATEMLAARNQGYELIAAEQSAGTAAHESAVATARDEAASRVSSGKAEIESQTSQARAELGSNAREMAEKIAADILEAK